MTPNSILARVLLWLKTCKKIRSAFRRSQISQSLVGYYRSEKHFIELAQRSHLTCKKIHYDRKYTTFLMENPNGLTKRR